MHYIHSSFYSVSVPGVKEVPPIPCHVHPGDVVEGRCVGHGKTEAYFFPPLDVPPYNLELGAVKTRLGLKPGTTKEQVCRCISILKHGIIRMGTKCHGPAWEGGMNYGNAKYAVEYMYNEIPASSTPFACIHSIYRV